MDKEIDVKKIEEWMDSLIPQTGDNWIPLQEWWNKMKSLISCTRQLEASNEELHKQVEKLQEHQPIVPLVYCKRHKTICMPFGGKLACCLESSNTKFKIALKKIIHSTFAADMLDIAHKVLKE